MPKDRANQGLSKDPYNLIITGVGGQGNVLASRIVGNLLSGKGFLVTIGETFGASQRGGSVMSHLRISRTSAWSPQIPKGAADLVLALEPIEALRVLAEYGNPGVVVLANTRSIFPVGVISGELAYPSLEDIQSWVREQSSQAYFLDATSAALEMGNPIFGNVIMVGALAGIHALPVDRESFEKTMRKTMDAKKTAANLAAFDKGAALVGS